MTNKDPKLIVKLGPKLNLEADLCQFVNVNAEKKLESNFPIELFTQGQLAQKEIVHCENVFFEEPKFD